jgi:hypothetical protein
MNFYKQPGPPTTEMPLLPGATRKAVTMDEFIDWAKSAEMKPVFDKLAREAVQMKQYLGADHVVGKRALWVLLTIEAICRQERGFQLEPVNDADVVEGIRIVGDLLLAAAQADEQPEPFESEDFWKDFLLGLCIAWGGPATEVKLDPHRLYSVQLRRKAS